jgi:hypothetical protein
LILVDHLEREVLGISWWENVIEKVPASYRAAGGFQTNGVVVVTAMKPSR